MKVVQHSHPENVTEFYASVVLWKNAADVLVIGIVDETERYVVHRASIQQLDVWVNTEVVENAIRGFPIPIARVGLIYNGKFEQAMQLVDAIGKIAPCSAFKAAKEDLDEPRPLLWSKFSRRVAKVGMETAALLAETTVRNREGRDDLIAVALAAEEYERRHRKFKRMKAPVKAKADRSHSRTEIEVLTSEIADLKSIVAAQSAQIAKLLEMQGNIA